MLALLWVLAGCAASTIDPGSIPEGDKFSEAGWSQARLDDAFLLAQNIGTCTLIVMTHGKTIQAMFDINTPPSDPLDQENLAACAGRAAVKLRDRLSGKKVAIQMSGGNAQGVELQTAMALPCMLDGTC